MANRNKIAGFTLIELLLVISIMSIIMFSIGKVMGISLVSIAKITDKEEMLADARHTMERITMFVQETDDITSPAIGESNITNLRVVERVLDTYDNSTHTFTINGDGILDADNDSDGYVNSGAGVGDPVEYVEFNLDGSILSIKYPDYTTADTTDDTEYETICENVTLFECDRLEDNLVEIRLTLNTGNNEVALKTRVFARNY